MSSLVWWLQLLILIAFVAFFLVEMEDGQPGLAIRRTM